MDEKKGIRTVEVDMRGQVCPSTLLVAMDNLNRYREELQKGEVALAIKTDNREATNTIPGTAENMGYKVLVTSMDGYYLVEILSASSGQEGL